MILLPMLALVALQVPGPDVLAPINPGDPGDPTLTVGDTQAAGLSREEMWRAPTLDDWQRPVLITFQRSWRDALAVSAETGKPILACINMDGEIASEHYAGVRYRDPEVAALYEPYVCVIASVYRHNAMDYDSEGNRFLCPRFGSVTCGEHIALEPLLYALYLDDTRVAPRHIVIEPDGGESQDIYYANDTASVFRVIHESAQGRPRPKDLHRTDRALPERVASAEISDREAVEAAFVAGRPETRRAILEAALASGGIEHSQLWRLALRSGSPELARLGVQGLSRSTDPAAIDLILASLRGLEHTGDRDVLIGTLERIGETSARARQLVRSFRGLGAKSAVIDGAGAGEVLAASGKGGRGSVVERLQELDRSAGIGGASYGAAAPSTSPVEEATRALERAEAQLALVRSSGTDPRFVELHREDASRELTAARPLLETDLAWRWELVDIAFDLARGGGPVFTQATEDRAAALVPRLSGAAKASGGLALRDVLSAFVRARERAIRNAARTRTEWPAEWMADAREAFRAIEAAPGTSPGEFIERQDFLVYMGAFAEADAVLDAALVRFPIDPLVHDRLRGRLLFEKRLGAIDGLEGCYEALLAAPEAPTELEWYAGYAARIAAEVHRRRGEANPAREAYARALAHFTESLERVPWTAASSETQIALCQAGRARVELELGEPEVALASLLASFERVPEVAAQLDGLNTNAILTAGKLRAALTGESLARLEGALESLRALDPHLFDPPDFEKNSIGRGPVGFGKKRYTGPR
jgi:tetratricopeptide (TPR) repeat protein